jgi:hypothetical protein
MKRQSYVLAVALCAALLGCGNSTSSNNGGSNPTPKVISVVQSVGTSAGCTQTSGCNSQSLVLPNPVQSGNLILIMLRWNLSNTNGSQVVTVTDSLRNNYVSIAPNTNAGSGGSLEYGFYANNVANGVATLQVSVTNSNGFGFDAIAMEIKGPSTLDVLGAPNSCGTNMPCTWTGGGCGTAGGCTTYSTSPFHPTRTWFYTSWLSAPLLCNGIHDYDNAGSVHGRFHVKSVNYSRRRTNHIRRFLLRR